MPPSGLWTLQPQADGWEDAGDARGQATPCPTRTREVLRSGTSQRAVCGPARALAAWCPDSGPPRPDLASLLPDSAPPRPDSASLLPDSDPRAPTQSPCPDSALPVPRHSPPRPHSAPAPRCGCSTCWSRAPPHTRRGLLGSDLHRRPGPPLLGSPSSPRAGPPRRLTLSSAGAGRSLGGSPCPGSSKPSVGKTENRALTREEANMLVRQRTRDTGPRRECAPDASRHSLRCPLPLASPSGLEMKPRGAVGSVYNSRQPWGIC